MHIHEHSRFSHGFSTIKCSPITMYNQGLFNNTKSRQFIFFLDLVNNSFPIVLRSNDFGDYRGMILLKQFALLPTIWTYV